VAHGSLPILRRHLLRRLFTLAAAISLLLCIATIVLWLRSYSTYDRWTRISKAEVTCQLSSESGRIAVFRGRYITFTSDGWHHDLAPATPNRRPIFNVSRFNKLDIQGSYFTLAHWLPCVIFAIAPTLWFAHFWRQRTQLHSRGFQVQLKELELISHR
jgi:hypothetical protein